MVILLDIQVFFLFLTSFILSCTENIYFLKYLNVKHIELNKHQYIRVGYMKFHASAAKQPCKGECVTLVTKCMHANTSESVSLGTAGWQENWWFDFIPTKDQNIAYKFLHVFTKNPSYSACLTIRNWIRIYEWLITWKLQLALNDNLETYWSMIYPNIHQINWSLISTFSLAMYAGVLGILIFGLLLPAESLWMLQKTSLLIWFLAFWQVNLHCYSLFGEVHFSITVYLMSLHSLIYELWKVFFLLLNFILLVFVDMRKIFPFELFHLGGDEVHTG